MGTDKPAGDVKSVVVVVIIATVCAAGLAFVKQGTAGAIKEAQRAETLYGVGKVVPEGCTVDLDRAIQWPEGEDDPRKSKTIYPAYGADGGLCALAVRTRNDTGYSGKVVMLAGFKGLESPEDLTLTRIYVLEHAETPGLGSKIADLQNEEVEQWGASAAKVFGLNFHDKPLAKMTYKVVKNSPAEGEIVTVTAATISSRAVTAGVQDAATVIKGDLGTLKQRLGGDK